MGAPVIRWQFISPNPDESAQFYSGVFGWTHDRSNAFGYREISTGSPEGIQGGLWPAPPGAPAFVQLFVQVADVAATVASAVAHGATVLVPASTLPNGDTMAVIRDPLGMSVGVMTPARTKGVECTDD